MANPITWQNVSDGGAAGNAARPLYYANESINRGFQSLSDVIGSVESNDRKNWIQQKSNNTQEFLDALAKYKTPEELAAAQADGSLDTLRQSYGAQVNRDEVRDAQQNRLNYLRDAILKQQSYDRTQNELAYQPLVDAYKAAKLKGTPEGEAEAAQILTNFPGMPNKADTMMFGRNIDRQDTKDAQDDALFKMRQELFPIQKAQAEDALLDGPSQRAARAIQSQTSLMQANTSRIQAENQAAAQAASKAAAAAKAAREQKDDAFEQLRKDSGMSSGTLDTEEGKKAFVEGLKSRNVSQKQADDILYNLNKYYSNGGITIGKDAQGNPITMPIPVSDALKAVEQATDNPLAIGFSRRGDDFVNILQNRFGDKSAVLGMDNTANQDKSRIAEIKAVLAASRARLQPLASRPTQAPDTTENPFTGGAKK